jgi:hypothetical protein
MGQQHSRGQDDDTIDTENYACLPASAVDVAGWLAPLRQHGVMTAVELVAYICQEYG